MTVKEVIALAAENLGREDLSAAVASAEGEPEGELKSLLRCYNLIENACRTSRARTCGSCFIPPTFPSPKGRER